MGSFDKDNSHSATNVMKVREADVTDDNTVLREILSQMRQTQEVLEKIQDNTKDTVKEMVWYKRREGHVSVYIRVSFVSVGDIDTVKQEFQCEFYMQVRWNEPELTGKTVDDIIEWENYWDPSIYIVDIVSFDIYERTQKLIPPQEEGESPDVVQYFHIKGTFKEVRLQHLYTLFYREPLYEDSQCKQSRIRKPFPFMAVKFA